MCKLDYNNIYTNFQLSCLTIQSQILFETPILVTEYVLERKLLCINFDHGFSGVLTKKKQQHKKKNKNHQKLTSCWDLA